MRCIYSCFEDLKIKFVGNRFKLLNEIKTIFFFSSKILFEIKAIEIENS